MALTPTDLGVGVAAGFTDRRGGVSEGPFGELNLARHVGDDPGAVVHNRAVLAGWLELPTSRLIGMDQVHGAQVAVVDAAALTAPAPTADALVTTQPELGLMVLVADCVPVLVADPHAGVVAAIHAGRAGVLAGVLQRALEVMLDLGARREQLRVSLGPAICGRCYEVPRALQQDVVKRYPAALSRTAVGTAALDLRPALLSQLSAADVRPEQVTCSPVCTLESQEYYSYRREQVTGRFAGVVALQTSAQSTWSAPGERA